MKKIYIVTGGGTGIGFDCAGRFKDGKVIITGRRENVLAEACKKLQEQGVDADFHTCDISDMESVKTMYADAAKEGTIAAVINSAGVSSDSSNFDQIIQIDLIGSYNMIEALKPYLSKETVLVLMSSIMGYVMPANPLYDAYLENPGQADTVEALKRILQGDAPTAYNLTKRGAQLLVQKYANEFGEKGARIVSVSPGIIITPMGEAALNNHPEQMEYTRMLTPLKRFGQPEEIANLVEFLVSDKAAFITGSDFLCDGGVAHSLNRSIALAQSQKTP